MLGIWPNFFFTSCLIGNVLYDPPTRITPHLTRGMKQMGKLGTQTRCAGWWKWHKVSTRRLSVPNHPNYEQVCSRWLKVQMLMLLWFRSSSKKWKEQMWWKFKISWWGFFSFSYSSSLSDETTCRLATFLSGTSSSESLSWDGCVLGLAAEVAWLLGVISKSLSVGIT